MYKIATAAVMCVLTAGCALFHSKADPYPTGLIFPVQAEARKEYEGEIIDRIEKREDRLYFSTRNGMVFCVDSRTQETIWRSKVSDDLAGASVLGEENIYVHDSRHTLFCLNEDGKLIWEKNVPSGISSEILESGGQVYLGTPEGVLTALQSSDGRELWRYEAGGAIRSNPVTGEALIIFGCDDHNLYFVDAAGRPSGTYETGGAVFASLAVDEGLLYFGTDDHVFTCMDLKRRKRKWRVRTGGNVVVPPVFDRKRLYLSSWNNVVFCLNKKRGDILWWNTVPSRSRSRLELIGDKLVATTQSETAVCFDAETGQRRGTYTAETEIMSNVSWADPYLLVSTFDEELDMTHLDLLGKEVAVTLKSAGQGSLSANEEAVFKATPVGFHKPKFEFFRRPLMIVPSRDYFYAFKESGERESVRDSSEESEWEWYPETPGIFGISVEVRDEKETAETEIVVVIMEKTKTVEKSGTGAETDKSNHGKKDGDVKRPRKNIKDETGRPGLGKLGKGDGR